MRVLLSTYGSRGDVEPIAAQAPEAPCAPGGLGRLAFPGDFDGPRGIEPRLTLVQALDIYDQVLAEFDLLLMPTLPLKATPLPPADARPAGPPGPPATNRSTDTGAPPRRAPGPGQHPPHAAGADGLVLAGGGRSIAGAEGLLGHRVSRWGLDGITTIELGRTGHNM